MKDLQQRDIESLLQELGQQLAKKFRSPVKILLISGAYMILELGNRSTTQDIDIYPLNIPDSLQPDKQTKQFLSAVRAVAKEYGLPRNWLNDAAFSLRIGRYPGETDLELWATYGMLSIYFPPRKFILAQKLFADRPKDHADIKALLADLGVQTRDQAQAVLDCYFDRLVQREYRVHLTLDRLFPR